MIGLKNCEARNGFGNAQCLAQYRSEMGKWRRSKKPKVS
jgi:hypothetical protein